MSDISFHIEQKNTWIPCLREESGLLDVTLGPQGLELELDARWQPDPPDRTGIIVLHSVARVPRPISARGRFDLG